MRDAGQGEERLWESGWDGQVRAQRERLGRLSLIEKLRWLEEAHAIVLHLQKARRTRGDGPSDEPTG